MRAVLVIIVVVLVLVILGWLRFSSPGGNPTLQVDTDKMKQDTERVIDSTKDAADNAVEAIEHR